MKKTLHILIYIFVISILNVNATSNQVNQLPYSTNNTNLTIWNGNQYIPFFIKGINLGVALPGNYPGELNVTKQQYAKWFGQIKSLGFNCIRIYTLHYPHFYEVLDSFNLANKHNPLLFFQGVWLNEEGVGYNHNLYLLSDTFNREIEENIDCVHGNKIIPQRFGKAYGNYNTNASKWNLGYIIGREIIPEEVLYTNDVNVSTTSFTGQHFSISSATPSEAWITARLNHVVFYEKSKYNTQRPVSCSSWPTLDPLYHSEEDNRMEDTATINLSKLNIVDAPAGFFISYHAYPYYPDFISSQTSYQPYSDNYGKNSYLGYLTELKSHYPQYPLIIAEYGVPSSWGIAHYASSGMNHGGLSELEQGETNIRLLNNINESNCGGGIQFSWIDEWFKRTWITDPLDYLSDRRILWHNVTAAEQNFGLISFQKQQNELNLWKSFNDTSSIQKVYVDADFDFFKLKIKLKDYFQQPDEIWVAIDTYDENTGESILPTGDTIPCRAEFALKINNHSASLYVTQAYDTYGIWHKISPPEQLYHSVVSNGKPWNLVKWKNNEPYNEVQYIGNLNVTYGFQPVNSNDAVTITEDSIDIRIPWTLLNVVDPSQMRVFNDKRNTPLPEDTISDGFAIAIQYQNKIYKTDDRFQWITWNSVYQKYIEKPKLSYQITNDRLQEFNTKAIAVSDSFEFKYNSSNYFVAADTGLLANDFDLDNNVLVPVIIDNANHGIIELNNNGSFTYTPLTEFTGIDTFTYSLFDGYSLSEPTVVYLNIKNLFMVLENNRKGDVFWVYPNPSVDWFKIESNDVIQNIRIFNNNGILIFEKYNVYTKYYELVTRNLSNGTYFVSVEIANKLFVKKVIIKND